MASKDIQVKQLRPRKVASKALKPSDSKRKSQGCDENSKPHTHDHTKCLQAIDAKDKLLSIQKKEIKALKQKIAPDSDLEKYENLEKENINLLEMINCERQKNIKLELKINCLTDNTTSTLSSQADYDSMNIITPLKAKVKKKEDENIKLMERITELESENRQLLEIIKSNEYSTQNTNNDDCNSESDGEKLNIVNQTKDTLSKQVSQLQMENKLLAHKIAQHELEHPVAAFKTKLIETKAMQKQIKKLNQRMRKLQERLVKTMSDKERTTKSKRIKPKQTLTEVLSELVKKLDNLTRNVQGNILLENDTNTKNQKTIHNSSNHTNHEENNNDHTADKPSLLLLSDFHGTELLRPLSRLRKGDYNFMADIINLGTTQRVLQDIENKTKKITNKDLVVIMCGGSDFNINPLNKVLNELENSIKNLAKTNVIVCRLPYCSDPSSMQFNQFAEKYNKAISKMFTKYDYVYFQTEDLRLNHNDYRPDGYKLSHSGKYKLVRALNETIKIVNENFYNSSSFL
ncbi:hypothetical protein O0L34_g15739 [Tuta absoluta]|nr:hypothetical protein O0L34_g15739 [Tuta absoluta]